MKTIVSLFLAATSFSFSGLLTAAETSITKISATAAQQGNPAIHAIDANPKTRWAQNGKGGMLEIEFSQPVSIAEIDLGFIKGSRHYRFAISFRTNKNSWSKPVEFVSGGKGDAVEAFGFSEIETSAICIINQGNNENDWINIHTLKIPGVTLSEELIAETKNSGDAGDDVTSDLEITEFAPTGMIGSPVGISVDNKGRVFVTETHRRKNSAPDVRSLTPLMLQAMASKTVDDKAAAIRQHVKDWKERTRQQEVIIRLQDTTGDGQADEKKTFFQGLIDVEDGVAAGVLCFGEDVFLTCIPSLYKLRDKNDDGASDELIELVRGLGIHIGYAGHDMHGPTIGPDGRIYWSMGDKGVSVKTKEGKRVFLPGQGGVFRVDPDGANFEVFVYGGRNPQELAFDDFGNLFIADNDGDMGDRERLHYVVRGCDVGWRSFYQYRGKNYNPWMAERLWETDNASQPAYLLPPLAYTANGPCGFVYNPGGALNEKYRGYFFLASSDKSTAAFQMIANGASFERANRHLVMNNTFATGLAFGPSGDLFAADWGNNGWKPHDKGRVLKLSAPKSSNNTLPAATARLLAEGMTDRSTDELATLLTHADQRVRLESQFELVNRNEQGVLIEKANAKKDPSHRLARIHAIWGVTQLARKDAKLAKSLVGLLTDDDFEIRAQAAQAMGEANYEPAGDMVAKLLADESPRVRLFAGIALERIGNASHLPQVLAFIEQNAGADNFLQHAGIMALAGIGQQDVDSIASLWTHPSPHVRISAVVALRNLNSPAVKHFVVDVDSNVAAEAARAIHDDLGIAEALPRLAKKIPLLSNPTEVLVRRAISANRMLAGVESAKRLATFASLESADESMRVEALETLARWNQPLTLDRVQGFYRGLPAARKEDAHAALDENIGSLLSSKSKAVQEATTRLITSLEYTNALGRVTDLFFDPRQEVGIRVSALRAMAALNSYETEPALTEALESDAVELRIAALQLVAKLSPFPKKIVKAAKRAISSKNLKERQAGFLSLGLLSHPSAIATLEQKLKALQIGDTPADTALEIYEAATLSTNEDVKRQLKTLSESLAKKPLGVHSLAIAGGDANRGETILKTSSVAQCTRCHRLGGTETSVGPDLAKIASKRDAAYLLRAIVTPSADIDEKYRTKKFLLESGKMVSGSIVSETDAELTIALGVDKIQRIAKDEIEEQIEQKISIMPEMGKSLSTRQIRDLVAYLKTLK